MCFSATASFAAAALLIPTGGFAVHLARSGEPEGDAATASSLLPLALMPVLFGVQQGLEGLVWLAIRQEMPPALGEAASLAYLFFAYGFWPVWIPMAVLRLTGTAGSMTLRRAVLWLMAALGVALAALLWLPLPFAPFPITPEVVHGSLHYPTGVVFPEPVLNRIGRLLYAATITLPLLLAARRALVIFAAGLLAAFALAEGLYGHAFSSVWCYFCALLSALIVWIVREETLAARLPFASGGRGRVVAWPGTAASPPWGGGAGRG